MPARPALVGFLLLLLLPSLLLSAGCVGAERVPERPVLSRSLSAAPVAAIPIVATARNPEMPWVWRVLKREVYARLPRVQSRTHRERNAVFAPVIVDGPYDSVPGVGVEGGF